MKNILEIDFRGNEGCTIDEIPIFSKHVDTVSNDVIIEHYEIHIKKKNGNTDILKFDRTFDINIEHSCFGEPAVIYKERK